MSGMTTTLFDLFADFITARAMFRPTDPRSLEELEHAAAAYLTAAREATDGEPSIPRDRRRRWFMRMIQPHAETTKHGDEFTTSTAVDDCYFILADAVDQSSAVLSTRGEIIGDGNAATKLSEMWTAGVSNEIIRSLRAETLPLIDAEAA